MQTSSAVLNRHWKD